MLQTHFVQIKDTMDLIDLELKKISNGKIPRFFSDVSVKVGFAAPEAGFLNLISFLYIILHEDESKLNYMFISDKIQSYKGDAEVMKSFKNRIHAMRTVLQHNVDPKKGSDKAKIYEYEDWLKKHIDKCDGLVLDDWVVCCEALMNEASFILNEILITIRQMNDLDEEFKIIVIEDWMMKLKNNFPLYRFRNIASKIAINLGFPYLDDEKFCQKHYKAWLSELSNLKHFEFDEYVTKQIERDFQKDLEGLNLPIPIDAIDIMTYFNIKPGKEVGDLLAKARSIYITNPSSKELLLDNLKATFDSKNKKPL